MLSQDQSLNALIAWIALSLLGLIVFTIYWVLVIRVGVKLGVRAANRERDIELAEHELETRRRTRQQEAETRTRMIPRQ